MKYLNSHQTRNDMDRLSAESCPVYIEALDRWTNEGGALGANGRAPRHAGKRVYQVSQNGNWGNVVKMRHLKTSSRVR